MSKIMLLAGALVAYGLCAAAALVAAHLVVLWWKAAMEVGLKPAAIILLPAGVIALLAGLLAHLGGLARAELKATIREEMEEERMAHHTLRDELEMVQFERKEES